MKAIRNIAILFGFSLVLFALAATAAKAQAVGNARFSGTFTLPFDAQWGPMSLPAGDYSLYYGQLNGAGTYVVEVAGKKVAGPHGFALPTTTGGRIETSENVLICILEGNKGYIRELRMGLIAASARFWIPHGVEVRSKLVAKKNHNQSGKAQLAAVAIGIERVPQE